MPFANIRILAEPSTTLSYAIDTEPCRGPNKSAEIRWISNIPKTEVKRSPPPKRRTNSCNGGRPNRMGAMSSVKLVELAIMFHVEQL